VNLQKTNIFSVRLCEGSTKRGLFLLLVPINTTVIGIVEKGTTRGDAKSILSSDSSSSKIIKVCRHNLTISIKKIKRRCLNRKKEVLRVA
jgi:hypothetical protein